MATRTHYFDSFFLDATRARNSAGVILASGLIPRAGCAGQPAPSSSRSRSARWSLAAWVRHPTDRRTVASICARPTALQAGFDNAQRTA